MPCGEGGRLRKGTTLLRVFLIVALLAGSAAHAHEQTRFDKDDSSGPLDVAASRLRHKVFFETSTHPESTRRLTEIRLRMATYEKWDSSLLSGRKNFVSFEFNLDDDAAIERCIVVTHGEFEPRVELHRDCFSDRDDLVRVLSGHRPDRHSIVVAVDRRQLRRRLRSFEWRTVTSFEDPDAQEGDPCWAATFPSPGAYGVCADSTRWRRHTFK